MTYFKQLINTIRNDQEGVTTTEYAVMLAIIAVTCLVSIGLLGEGVRTALTMIGNAMSF